MGKSVSNVIQKVSDLDKPPKVGVVYLVPHAKVWDHYDDKVLYIPVIGHLHEDPDLGPQAGQHYHFDLRFLDPADGLSVITTRGVYGPPYKKGRTNAAISLKDNGSRFQLRSRKTILKPTKCIRSTTGVDPDYNMVDQYNRCFVVDWYRKYEGKKAIDMRCPHKGFNLRQCPNRKGVIECPLHGLKFRASDMTVISLEEAYKYEPVNCVAKEEKENG